MPRFAISLLLTFVFLASSVRGDTVAILMAEQSSSHGEFARALENEFKRVDAGLNVVRIKNVVEVEPGVRVLVAVGTRSLRQVVAMPNAPLVVGALVPSTVFSDIPIRQGVSAVFLDQHPLRQMLLIRLLLPDARRVGMLAGRAQEKNLSALSFAAEKLGLQPRVVAVSSADALFDSLQQVTATSDVLLAWPDATVFNPQTIQSILLTTYRQRKPLIGFSSAYTRAGALAAVHSSVSQLAAQTVEMVRIALVAATLPEPQYPKEFEVSLNRQVARSLGMELPTEESLVDQVKLRESEFVR